MRTLGELRRYIDALYGAVEDGTHPMVVAARDQRHVERFTAAELDALPVLLRIGHATRPEGADATLAEMTDANTADRHVGRYVLVIDGDEEA
jgi:hypothetical protein